MDSAAITFDQVGKTFRGGTVALRDVNFAVEEGEVFGLIGPNGAGKTTAIRLILDLLRPTSGSISVLGQPSRAGSIQIRKHTGYLPGELHLDERLDARETLRWFGHLRGLKDVSYALSLGDRFELPLDRPIGELSKGNKQKVGLIQALMHRPRLVILDEPTSGLDPILQRLFVELVNERRADGATFLISSHVLSELEHVADRIGMVRDGHLFAVEQIGDLKRNAPHRVAIRFAAPVEADLFEGVDGVSNVAIDGTLARLNVHGSMGEVVKAAATREVVDFQSSEPDLEEIFLAYYDGHRT